MHPRQQSGLTLVEALVIIGILVALVLVTPHCGQTHALVRGQMTQTLSNMKQLHLATQSMELDGTTMPDTNRSWPGDTGGTFTNWVRLIVPDYLGTNDLCKMLSAPGVAIPINTLPSANNTGLRVYSVSSNSPALSVFLTTANFTNSATGGNALDPKAKPYGDKGFVVFRKDGSGAILQPRQVGQTNVIGTYMPLCK